MNATSPESGHSSVKTLRSCRESLRSLTDLELLKEKSSTITKIKSDLFIWTLRISKKNEYLSSPAIQSLKLFYISWYGPKWWTDLLYLSLKRPVFSNERGFHFVSCKLSICWKLKSIRLKKSIKYMNRLTHLNEHSMTAFTFLVFWKTWELKVRFQIDNLQMNQ